MLGARILLLVSLAIGLVAVGFAARAQLRERQAAEVRQRERELRLDLEEQARARADRLAEYPATHGSDALYDAQGRLLRPAPPSVARAWEPPRDTETAIFLRAGRVDEALASARDSRDRAAALVAKGARGDDPALLEEALREEALAGTDLALRVRLELTRPPDEEWIDDVSALLGGPSDRLARSLLVEAGVAPIGTRAWRERLAGLRVVPGVRVAGDEILVAHGVESGALELWRLPLSAWEWGAGPVAVPLPEPWEALSMRGTTGMPRLEAPLRTLLPYGLAGLLLVVATAYAVLAIGRAHRLARARADFVANVTHELKTPLANIRLYAESLQSGRVREADRAGFLQTVLDEAGRLDALVEGLLHVARGRKLAFERLDAAELIHDAQARWRERLDADGVALRVVVPGGLPAMRADRAALERALDNLLDNARKYGGSSVELSAGAADGHVRLALRDHGPGIPVGERERMLRPFERLESGDRRETAGAGLGLSLVVSTMEAHRGRVEIEAPDGGGTRVVLVVPVGEES